MTGRALIMAGGGIRVAWQTGVIAALKDAGFEFDHGDGTSGGIFTLGMLLSGQECDEMIARWHAVDIKAFMSLLPLRAYLRSPTNWTAFGSASGVRDRVLPALGIDLERIRAASGMTGSFNVADFTRKRCIPIPHAEIDIDRLIAGVSLAAVMPAVEYGGRMWTDAVWIQDANPMHAVEQGCTELWILWCIGNTPRWGTGSLEQYVHMIEMSATSSLSADLDTIADVNRRRAAGEAVLGSTEPVLVHLIRPALPLPLDPDLIAGRIDTETLIAMGYRDGCRYLATRRLDGIPLDETATQTPARQLGARLVIRARDADDREFGYTVVIEADDLSAICDHPGADMPAVGAIRHPQHGYRLFTCAEGRLVGSGGDRSLVVDATVPIARRDHRFRLEVPLPAGRPSAASRQQWELCGPDGDRRTGTAALTPGELVRILLTFEAAGAHNLRDRLRALTLATRAIRQGGGRLPAGRPAQTPTVGAR